MNIVIYGKGGVGKSMIAANLSCAYAKKGYKVLHIGCDPKGDSTYLLRKGDQTALEKIVNNKVSKKEDLIEKGINNIHCIEAGGPLPGSGCAGYGIALLLNKLNELEVFADYDVVVYDVLGDVVCGGFAAPVKLESNKKVYVVVSEEIMSMYAANNIFLGIEQLKKHKIEFGGMILNHKTNEEDLSKLNIFGEKTKSSFVTRIPRSDLILKSECLRKPIIELYPDSKVAFAIYKLVEKSFEENFILPGPLSREEFNKILM